MGCGCGHWNSSFHLLTVISVCASRDRGVGGLNVSVSLFTILQTPLIKLYYALPVFLPQALRILVNNELNELDYAMRLSQYYLRPSGVLVAISFHSLEDTIVKRHLKGMRYVSLFFQYVSEDMLYTKGAGEMCQSIINIGNIGEG